MHIHSPCSYHLPHQLHCAKVYPLTSPNGSSIVVYGHANGIRLIWVGGKPFKELSGDIPEKKLPDRNVDNDAVMILDSDEEDTPIKPQKVALDDPEFEQDATLDSEAEYSPIIQHLDLPLGTGVLQLSFPPVPTVLQFLPTAFPKVATEQIVMAATCSDCTVRLITVPLLPPSPAKKRSEQGRIGVAYAGDGTWGERIVKLGGLTGHQQIPTDVAVTFTSRSMKSSEKDDVGEEDISDQSTVSSNDGSHRATSQSGVSSQEEEWDLLVASISPEKSGVLLVYQIPIISSSSGPSTKFGLSAKSITPIQTQRLYLPALSISFNPALQPAKRHSYLLLTESTGCLRLYDCCTKVVEGPSPSDDAQSSTDGGPTYQGSWLITLHAEFQKVRQPDDDGLGATPTLAKRKEILDAKWVLGGSGIIVLLSDGEWGVWDIEGAGPGPSRTGLISSSKDGRVGVRGGALTAWSLRGRIDEAVSKAYQSRMSTRNNEGISKLVPRTPRTRKIEERLWLSGGATKLRGHSRGGVTVRSLSASVATHPSSDAIVLWYESTIAVIPNLRSFWETRLAKTTNTGSSNLLDSDPASQMTRLNGVKIPGGVLSDVDLFPCAGMSKSGARKTGQEQHGSSNQALPCDVLVSGARHLIILSNAAPDSQDEVRGGGEERGVSNDRTNSGSLAIDGIDRALSNMQNHGTRAVKGLKKKVGFLEGA